MKTLCTILAEAADAVPEQPLYVFPQTRWNEPDELTFSQLAIRAAAAARTISEYAKCGERALLLLPTGAAFWEAFLGSLACRVIAVPLKSSTLNRWIPHLEKVVRDCRPTLLVTDPTSANQLETRPEINPALAALPRVTADHWRMDLRGAKSICVPPASVAFLQYTSGSTADPKGIQVSHQNLISNMELIRRQMRVSAVADMTVTWLPHYHDMGLVGSYLTSLFARITCIALPPEEFAAHPARWLELISEHGATICGGPDFAYRMCVDRIGDDQLDRLKLSSWRIAFVGAERVRAETLHRFSTRFSRTGFCRTSFFPCYGLGEATLMATGGPEARDPVIRQVSGRALRSCAIEPPHFAGDEVSLVGCGQMIDGLKVKVVNRETGIVVDDEVIGEIYLGGPSITDGYFERDEWNEQTFVESIDGKLTGRFLKTGDLGFLSAGELFVTGRVKELIIVKGRNLFPEDIEQLAEAAHPAIQPRGAVAFSVESGSDETLVIAVELKRECLNVVPLETITAAIRMRVATGTGVNPSEVILLRPMTIPRTSSGKLKRLAAREQFRDESLPLLFRSPAGVSGE